MLEDHGFFRKGQILDVLDIIPYTYKPETQYVVIAGGNTIPREKVEWYSSEDTEA